MAFMMAAAPYISAAGTAMGVLGQIQAANAQASIASQNAAIERQNAIDETVAMNRDMLARDQEAAGSIAELQASMDASGITSGSGSMLLKRKSLEQLAARDRENLAAKRDANLQNRLQSAAGLGSQARAYKSGAFLSALGGMANIGTSYLSTATMVNDYKRSTLRSSNPSIMG